MPRTPNKCKVQMEEALRTIDGLSTDSAIKDFAVGLESEIRVQLAQPGMTADQAVDAVVKKTADKMRWRALSNVRGIMYMRSIIENNPEVDVGELMHSLLVGKDGIYTDSVSSRAATTASTMWADFKRSLKNPDTAYRMQTEPEFARTVTDLTYKLDNKIEFNKADVDSDALDMAEALRKSDGAGVNLVNSVGGTIDYVDVGWLRTQHNQHLISANKDGWYKFMEDRLDYMRVFGQSRGDVEPADLEAMLNHWYQELSTGAFDVVLNHTNASSDMSRKIHFKDGPSYYDYWDMFGRSTDLKIGIPEALGGAGVKSGSKHDTMMHAFQRRQSRLASEYGMVSILGPSYATNIEKVMNEARGRFEQEGTPAARRQLKSIARYTPVIKNDLKMVSGESSTSSNENVSMLSGFLTRYNISTLLNGVAASMLPDGHIMATKFAQAFGGSKIVDGWAAAISNYKNVFDAKDFPIMLRAMGVETDATGFGLGFDLKNADAQLGMWSKITMALSEASGMRSMSDAMRGGALAWSAEMADMSRAYTKAQLEKSRPDFVQQLKVYNLWNDWDDLKLFTHNQKGIGDTHLDGHYLDASTVDEVALDNPKLIAYADKKNMTPARARQDVKDRLGSALNQFMNGAVVKPTAGTRKLMGKALQQGEGARFAADQMMLFKGYPIAVINQLIMEPFRKARRGARAEGLEGMDAATAQLKAGLPFLASTIVGTTLLGALSVMLKDASRGQQRDWNRADSWMAAMAQGGGMGIIGDFIVGDMKNRYGGGMTDTLAGPTVGKFAQFVDILQRVRDGDDVGAASFRFIYGSIPGTNHLLLRGLLQHYVVNTAMEAINPGSVENAAKAREQNIGVTSMF